MFLPNRLSLIGSSRELNLNEEKLHQANQTTLQTDLISYCKKKKENCLSLRHHHLFVRIMSTVQSRWGCKEVQLRAELHKQPCALSCPPSLESLPQCLCATSTHCTELLYREFPGGCLDVKCCHNTVYFSQ